VTLLLIAYSIRISLSIYSGYPVCTGFAALLIIRIVQAALPAATEPPYPYIYIEILYISIVYVENIYMWQGTHEARCKRWKENMYSWLQSSR
jgi:hypothetical protein